MIEKKNNWYKFVSRYSFNEFICFQNTSPTIEIFVWFFLGIVKMQTSYSPYRLLVTALIILWLTIMMRLIKELIIYKQPRFLPWQIFSVHKYMKVYRNIPDIKVIINSILYVHILLHFIQGIITVADCFGKANTFTYIH